MHRFVLITGSFLFFGAVAACGTAATTDGPAIEEHWMPYAEAAALVAFLNDTDVATELMLDERVRHPQRRRPRDREASRRAPLRGRR